MLWSSVAELPSLIAYHASRFSKCRSLGPSKQKGIVSQGAKEPNNSIALGDVSFTSQYFDMGTELRNHDSFEHNSPLVLGEAVAAFSQLQVHLQSKRGTMCLRARIFSLAF